MVALKTGTPLTGMADLARITGRAVARLKWIDQQIALRETNPLPTRHNPHRFPLCELRRQRVDLHNVASSAAALVRDAMGER